MKKYEACGAITEIQRFVSELLDNHKRYAEKEAAKKDTSPEELASMKAYWQRESAKLERWLQALEIAGTALTR